MSYVREPDDETDCRGIPVRRVLEEIRYSVTRALAATDEELEVVAPDFRDAWVSAVPASLFLEELRETG